MPLSQSLYTIVYNQDEIIQFDWLIHERKDITLVARINPFKSVSEDMIGKKVKEVIKDLQYFTKPL